MQVQILTAFKISSWRREPEFVQNPKTNVAPNIRKYYHSEPQGGVHGARRLGPQGGVHGTRCTPPWPPRWRAWHTVQAALAPKVACTVHAALAPNVACTPPYI